MLWKHALFYALNTRTYYEISKCQLYNNLSSQTSNKTIFVNVHKLKNPVREGSSHKNWKFTYFQKQNSKIWNSKRILFHMCKPVTLYPEVSASTDDQLPGTQARPTLTTRHDHQLPKLAIPKKEVSQEKPTERGWVNSCLNHEKWMGNSIMEAWGGPNGTS